MKKIVLILLLSCCFVGFAFNSSNEIENNKYKVIVIKQQKEELKFLVTDKTSKISRTLTPKIHIAFSSQNPNLVPSTVDSYNGIVGWKAKNDKVINNIFNLDGIDIIASEVETQKNKLVFTFKPCEFGVATLEIELPKGEESPSVVMRIKIAKEGWYSMGFTGITAVEKERLDFLYQPLTWSWKRFPSQSCITEEAYSTTAATFINFEGMTEGIAASPEMIPYRYALSTRWSNKTSNKVGTGFAYSEKKGNSLFGFLLRNNEGLAQPTLFAPLLGGENSFMKKGQEFRFVCKYILTAGDWVSGTEFLLRNVFKYKNERQNVVLSLNQTLENMIDLGMNDRLSGWLDEYKGFDYIQDAPGTVKIVSALHALGIALSTGDYEIYKHRALPLIEYIMSREKFLFSYRKGIDGNINFQSPSHFLNGPCAEIGELAGLYQMTGGKSVVFKKEAERLFGKARKLNLETVSEGATWKDYMAKYKISGNSNDLMKAEEGAKSYIDKFVNKYPEDFASNSGLKDKEASFQNDFTTNIYDLFELWEITKNKVYLEASRIGARQLALWARSNPMAPDSLITVNKGGKVEGVFPGRRDGTLENQFKIRDMSTKIAEQKIPAWRTSLVGLVPEQQGTYTYGPIMLSHYAAWFLRIAALTNDKLLADVAYNAIIGRYANYPGYYFTSLDTNVYQGEDYIKHDYKDVKYNAIFYNHVWPHIALINDFLISDAFYRSKGKIDFPSVYAPGYAFLTSKVYGGKSGEIYGNKNINLWLPRNALKKNNVAFNHVFGVGKDALYLALMNTSKKEEYADIQLNQDKIAYDSDKNYQILVYDADGIASKANMTNGRISVKIPANSLITVKINDLVINVPLININDKSNENENNENYFREINNEESLGTITGMMINLATDFSDAYIYSDVTEKNVKKAILQYKIGNNDWQQSEDSIYPYEFSIHLSNSKQPIIMKWLSEDNNGKITESKEMKLVN
jgi:hypothetical protein